MTYRATPFVRLRALTLLAVLAAVATAGCSTFHPSGRTESPANTTPDSLTSLTPGKAQYPTRASEDLSVVFLVHPRCDLAAGEGEGESDLSRVFRHVASNFLSETFRSAIEVRSEEDLREIESYRDLVLRSGKNPLWLLDPAVLVVVDLREASTAALGGQLHLRMLDLRLARALGLSYETLERDLYNKRALICEGFEEVGIFEAPELATRELWVAWQRLTREIFRQPRYAIYREAVTALADEPGGDAGPAGEAAARLQLLFFGEVPESLRPYRVAGGAEGFEDRVREIESRLLFGRPADALEPAAVDDEVTPREAKAGTSASPEDFPPHAALETASGTEGEPTGVDLHYPYLLPDEEEEGLP